MSNKDCLKQQKNALVTVFEKEGIEKQVRLLVENNFIVYTTLGTYEYLKEKNFERIVPLSSITGFKELLGGRVKTLDQRVFASILATSSEDFKFLQQQNLPFFSIVFVELYPFLKESKEFANTTPEELAKLIEYIDIGGVSLIRAAAKNYKHTCVIVDRNDLELALKAIEDEELRKILMIKAFKHTAQYDWNIIEFFDPKNKALFLEASGINLRYGENPHQKAICWKVSGEKSLFEYKVESKKGMSFNNYVDFDALIKILRDIKNTIGNCCVIIKHTNPCGVGLADNMTVAFKKSIIL